MENDYKKMYMQLFNAVTDALELMPRDSKGAKLLRTAQIYCEEYIILRSEGLEQGEFDHLDE